MEIRICPVKPWEVVYAIIPIVIAGTLLYIDIQKPNIPLILGQIIGIAVVFAAGWIVGTDSTNPLKNSGGLACFIIFALAVTSISTEMIIMHVIFPEATRITIDIITSPESILALCVANVTFLIGYLVRWASKCIEIVR